MFSWVGAHSLAPLSRHVDRIMGELALHGKATGVWSEGNFRRRYGSGGEERK